MDNNTRAENPSANCVSNFFLWYMNGTFTKGYKRPLANCDVFQIREENSSKKLCFELENIWEEETNKDGGEPSLFKAIFRMSRSQLLLIGLCLLVREVFCIAQCVFLRQVLCILSNDILDNNAIYWTLGIAGCIIFQHLLFNLSHYTGLQVGLNLRSAVVAMLYKKALQIPEGSLRTITTSHVSNIISDSNILLEGFTLINFIWIGPLVFIGVVVILWMEIGPSCLAGIGLIIILIPIQICLHKFIAASCGVKTGKRGTIIKEIIVLMQAIKLYSVEDSFEEKIKYLRTEEIESSKKYVIVCVFQHALSGVIWYLFLLITFSVYSNIGNEMKLSSMILTLSLSFILYQTMALYFPSALHMLKKFRSNSNKIQTFLKSGLRTFECSKQTDKGDSISVTFDNVTASWFGSETSLPTLSNVVFKVDKINPLVMIVGPPGSGKSSILLTVLNELNITSGKVIVNGSTSYAAQNIWLFPATIKDNIIFGNKFEKARYDEVIYSCCLTEDIALLKNGDFTLIGQTDTSIVEELQAKICMARAAYHHGDIYLFDNLLSLVSPEVGKNMFDRCIRGFLHDKVIMLVTNQIQYLDYATDILCLNKNGTCTIGSLFELSREGVDIVTLLHPGSHEKQWDEDSAIETDGSIDSADDEQEKSRILGGVSLIPTKDFRNANSGRCLQTNLEHSFSIGDSQKNLTTTHTQFLYSNFWKNLTKAIGWFPLAILVLLNVSGQILLTITDYWFAVWAEGNHQRFTNATYNVKWYFYDSADINLYITVALVVLCMVMNLLRTMNFQLTMVKCTCKIHDSMMTSLLKAPMSFFDNNNVNSILSHFTNDIHFMDAYLPSILCQNAHFVVFTLAIIIFNCVNIPILAAIFIPLIIVFYMVKCYYTRTLRKIRSLEVSSQIPLHTHISSTFRGITTIRSFSSHEKVIKAFYALQDHHSEAWMMLIMVRMWIAQRKSFIAILFSLVSIFAPLVASRYIVIDHIISSICLVHVFTINELFQWYTWKNYDLDTLMSSAECLFQYTKLDSEVDDGESAELRETWPEIGLITGEDASFAYKLTLPYVLRRLYFCIRAREKVGIVGNPGAGKSSFILMLFHMAKVNGIVCIDGYPIKDLTLKDLRRTISIIPENPVIFTSSLRQNLDPNMQHSDGDIWEALEDVQMKDVVIEYPEKLDTVLSMTRYNIQERKLLCLARVILENRKILVIDGAVPSSDHKTERIIQRIIREKFKDSTVIMVAYRLNTIMDLDRVMVVDSGKIVEFDEPFTLLQNSNGHFRKLVDQAGKTEAARLEVLADEARKLRHVILLQNQIAFPGSNITSSKSRNEILNHFGTRIIYETVL